MNDFELFVGFVFAQRVFDGFRQFVFVEQVAHGLRRHFITADKGVGHAAFVFVEITFGQPYILVQRAIPLVVPRNINDVRPVHQIVGVCFGNGFREPRGGSVHQIEHDFRLAAQPDNHLITHFVDVLKRILKPVGRRICQQTVKVGGRHFDTLNTYRVVQTPDAIFPRASLCSEIVAVGTKEFRNLSA